MFLVELIFELHDFSVILQVNLGKFCVQLINFGDRLCVLLLESFFVGKLCL